MTPAELIALAEKHNILIPNAFDKDSFEETSGWTDKKWERFIQYYGYDENDDAIMESIEYFEEQDEEEEEQDKCRCVDCDYSICKSDFDLGKGRIMWYLGDDAYRCGVCDDRCDEEGELLEDHEDDEDRVGAFGKEEEEEEPTVIVDPEKIWVMCDVMAEKWREAFQQTRAIMLIEGVPFDNILVRGLTDRQLEVLGRFVNRCKKSD